MLLSSADSVTRTGVILAIPSGERTFRTYNHLGGEDSEDDVSVPVASLQDARKGMVVL